jgi:hypothetical protein
MLRAIDYIADRRSFRCNHLQFVRPGRHGSGTQQRPGRLEYPHNPNNQLDPPVACACASAYRRQARLTFRYCRRDHGRAGRTTSTVTMHRKRSARMSATLAQVACVTWRRAGGNAALHGT